MKASSLAIRVACVAVGLAAVCPRTAHAQGANIGLYTDVTGNTCSFTGNAPGPISAYVVFRPDAGGVNTVQFSAPVPSCLGAVYLGETVTPGMMKMGNSQTGVSVLLQACYGQPVSVMRIDYMRSGSTDPCCPYPILPDPTMTHIAASDCAYNDVPVTSVVSHFNADASCECEGNSPPSTPTTPIPQNASSGHSVTPQMSWFAQDYDNNIASYDVYLGTSSPPALVASGLPTPAFTPASPLSELTPHYWRVVVRDALGLEATGPVWSFTTRVANSPPFPPSNPVPASTAQDISLDATLAWQGSDIDLDPLTYDVYFGTTPSPPLVAADLANGAYNPGGLQFGTTYYWRIVARDDAGLEMSGPTWSLTTRPANYAPNAPSTPSPPNNAVDRPLDVALSWQATDRDNDPLVFDVYFGTSTTPPLVASNLASATYSPAGLVFSTKYYWRIVARDTASQETTGPTWNFTSRPVNLPPDAPSNPSPAHLASNQPQNTILSWQGTDPDNNPLTYDVYFGTSSTPPLVASNVSAAQFAPGVLGSLTTYRWRIVARDNSGATTSGPTWRFSTEEGNRPPNSPSNPSPGSGQNNQPPGLILAWTCSDPDGDALTYDVYFGENSPPTLVASNQTATTYATGPLEPSNFYYWQIRARDSFGNERLGPNWMFVTRANTPPNPPTNPVPNDGAFALPANVMLSWLAVDPTGDPMTFEVWLGTSPNPPRVAINVVGATYNAGFLIPNTQYYWRIVARDTWGATATSPTWSFWTLGGNYPPTTPSDPSPANGATQQSINATLSWQTSDPGGGPVTCDVFLGLTTNPPLAASGVTNLTYQANGLAWGAVYYWRIRARDVEGAETLGPLWTFTTGGNQPPNAPNAAAPPNGSVNQSPTSLLAWSSVDPDGQALTHDVYFGTESHPPLVASNLSVRHYAPGVMAFTTTYRWRVVVRDPHGFETSGPVWSFTTRANLPPAPPYAPSPVHEGASDTTPTLSWTTFDVDPQSLTHAVYFGTTSPPPLVESSLASASYDPGPLQPATRYYWQVITSDGIATSASPIWTFTAVDYGDVVPDGQLTVADASCALRLYLQDTTCGGVGSSFAADVNCSGGVTPTDARCIHRKVADGSCAFCQDAMAREPGGANVPLITLTHTSTREDTLIARLAVSPLSSFASFGFSVMTSPKVRVLEARRRGATNSFTALDLNEASPGAARVGGYSLAETQLVATTEFIELRFDISHGLEGTLRLEAFIDDLLHGANYTYTLGNVVSASPTSTGLVLHQNHPNPFNPQTTITYDLPSTSERVHVRLSIVDISGRVVKTLVDESQGSGSHRVEWQGKDDRGESVSSGVYFYVLDVAGERRTRKLVLLK